MGEDAPRDVSKLRRGYSTGACAAAAAKAAWTLLSGRSCGEAVELLFPDGQRRRMPLKESARSGAVAMAAIVKDAGDDPDVTDKALIRAKVSFASPADASEKDYLTASGQGGVIIRGGKGVGLATRDGLAAEKGRWAVNPVPRRMIEENLRDAGFGARGECLLVEIEVDGGEELAKKTLNPVLGVVGGISILGTSGFVEPYSNAAYIDTIKLLVAGARKEGAPRMAFCTGGSTLKAARRIYPELPETAFARIADFIEESLKAASDSGFSEISVVCMEGKLLKYASGFGNTHAWRNAMPVQALKPLLLKAGLPPEEAERIASFPSVREAMSSLPKDQRIGIIKELAREALKTFKAWAPGASIEVLALDAGGEPLLKCNERDLECHPEN